MAALTGRTQSPEANEKNHLAHIGKKMPPGTGAKVAAGIAAARNRRKAETSVKLVGCPPGG
jgi:hypothetical protein